MDVSLWIVHRDVTQENSNKYIYGMSIMRLKKTEKAHQELQSRQRRLGHSERTLLILADGQKNLSDIAPYLKHDARPLAEGLIRDGYLTDISRNHVANTPSNVKPSATIASAALASSTDVSKPLSTQTSEALQTVNTDNFDGKRSLATTRMFLFDLCERMFSRGVPGQAQAFREALRNAKDRESMLAVSREMMLAIEQVAGPERADSISQRIAMLLPVQP